MKKTGRKFFNAGNVAANMVAMILIVLVFIPICFRFYKNYKALERFEKCRENIIKIHTSAKVFRMRNGSFKLNDSEFSQDYDIFNKLNIELYDPYFSYFFYHEDDARVSYSIKAFAKNPMDNTFGTTKVEWITNKGECNFEYNKDMDTPVDRTNPTCF